MSLYLDLTVSLLNVYTSIHSAISYGSSSGIPGLSCDDSSRRTSLLIGRSSMDPFEVWTVTDLTWPWSSWRVASTLAKDHWFLHVLLSFSNTTSPSVKFLCCLVHLFLTCRLCNDLCSIGPKTHYQCVAHASNVANNRHLLFETFQEVEEWASICQLEGCLG